MPETKEEKIERECNELIEAEVVNRVDSHTERVKSVLIALRMAKIPLTALTASALHELCVWINSINEEMED